MQKQVFMLRKKDNVEFFHVTYDDSLTAPDGDNKEVNVNIKFLLTALRDFQENPKPYKTGYDKAIAVCKKELSPQAGLYRKKNIGYITLIDFDDAGKAITNVSCYPNEQRTWQRELAQSAADGNFAIDNAVRVK